MKSFVSMKQAYILQSVQSGKLGNLRPCNALQCWKFTGASSQILRFDILQPCSLFFTARMFVSWKPTAELDMQFTTHSVLCQDLGSCRVAQSRSHPRSGLRSWLRYPLKSDDPGMRPQTVFLLEASLRRYHGGAILEEEPLRRNHGAGIIEEE